MEYLGTDYGGWLVNLNLIPEGSTVISAGVGEDISFDLELIKKKRCNIVGIDPTKKSHIFIESQRGLSNFSLIKRALDAKSNDVAVMYQNNNPLHVSESMLPTHKSVNNFQSYYAETIALDDLFKKYADISLIKMDIEGSEYNVLESLNKIPDTVKQLCIEFHHFCSDYTLEDTKNMIDKLSCLGFTKCHQNKPNSFAEVTLTRSP